MMKFKESLGQGWQRLRNGGGRKPLRTIQELAEEFGVDHRWLGRILKSEPTAPRPVINLNHVNASSKAQWFDPQEMRRWWAEKNTSK